MSDELPRLVGGNNIRTQHLNSLWKSLNILSRNYYIKDVDDNTRTQEWK